MIAKWAWFRQANDDDIAPWRRVTGHRFALPAVTVAMAMGITAGRYLGGQPLWLWTALIIIGLALAWRWRKRPRLSMLALLVAVLSIGSVWIALREQRIPRDDLRRFMTREAQLVQLRGVAMRRPEIKQSTNGAMARFDYREPAMYFPMEVRAFTDRSGTERSVTGRVLVRIDEMVPMFEAGDEVSLFGLLLPFMPPMNPGAFDYSKLAKAIGQAGMVTVEARDAVQIQPRPEPAWRLAFKRWRENLQRRASGWLLSDLPHRPQVESRTSRRDALLQALLLGKREPSAQELDNRVRRVGLAHLLAISGLHLAILAGFVLMLVRFGGRERRWHGVIIIAIVLSYLALIDVRLPVLRAAVMICFGCLGLTFGRRAHAGGLVCLSAIVLLLWRPHQLFTPGFQLSFGVVLGLIYFAGPLRVRMFGSPNEVAATSGEMLGETLKTWIAAALTAWLISAPITMYHFGTIALYAVPLTILCLPLLAVILVLGFAKMICSLVLPSVGLIVGVPLSITADIFLAIVDGADAMPFATILTVKPSVVWIVLAFIVIAGIALARHWRVRRRFYWTAAALIVWIILRMLPIWPTPALRIDMLAVGNGSCYLVRSDHHAVLFDAGSGSDLDVGSNTIIPALRELGVRSLDAIVISHANLDHYCGVLDVVDGLPVKQIIITPQLQQAAMDDPASPIAFVLRRLNQQQLSQVAVSRGDQYMFGDAQWSWLHPARHDTFEHVNDKSMVIAVDAGYRRLLLTGDIQSEAIDALNQREPQLAADIIELPHHGSMNAEALGLVLDLDATVIMQSTGPRRLENDRWAEPLAAVERLITARDGAGWVEVDEQDTITLGRFVAE